MRIYHIYNDANNLPSQDFTQAMVVIAKSAKRAKHLAISEDKDLREDSLLCESVGQANKRQTEGVLCQDFFGC